VHPTPTLIPTAAVTATAAVSAAPLTLACTVRQSEGSSDDETKQTLTCKVTHARAADTRFTLHYSIRDPIGNLHPFTQTCDGSLRNGGGTCTQTYEFIVPFAPVPGPVTGETLPSHHKLGPVTPTT
jgi:hypothetical protein